MKNGVSEVVKVGFWDRVAEVLVGGDEGAAAGGAGEEVWVSVVRDLLEGVCVTSAEVLVVVWCFRFLELRSPSLSLCLDLCFLLGVGSAVAVVGSVDIAAVLFCSALFSLSSI